MNSNTFHISGSVLKTIALLSMTVDHTGACLLEGSTAGSCLRMLGRMAFPLYAFLLSEGITHTRNPLKYILRLLSVALVSEVPYDLLFFSCPWNADAQNVMFTLTLSAVMMLFWDSLKEYAPARVAICASVALLAYVLDCDYGLYGVCLPWLFYVLRKDTPARILTGMLTSTNIFQCGAYIPIALYNGERGFIKGHWGWLFYAYYPLHICILLILKNIL